MMRRLTFAVVVMALLASGCASTESDGYDVADAVLARLDQPVPVTTASPGDNCTIEIVEDEYGFKNEVTTCESTEPAVTVTEPPKPDQPLDPASVLAQSGDLDPSLFVPLRSLAPEAALEYFLPMSETLDDLGLACGSDFFAWRASLSELADQVADLSEAIGDGRLEGYVGTSEARAFSRALLERALLQTDCSNPGGGAPFTESELTADGTLDLTSRAALGLSEMGRLLSVSPLAYLFHFYTTADNYQWLRTQRSAVDIVVYGTSQAGAGIDVPLLSEQMAANVGNAWVAGSLAEVQQHWFPEVERYVDPKTVVWLVGGIDLLMDCAPVGREEQFTDRLGRRERTFAAAGWFELIDHANLILGPVGPENTNKGDGIKRPGPDGAATEAHARDYKERFAAPEFCDARAEIIAQSVRRMVADGRRVVIVGMPLSPGAYEDLLGGSDTASSAISQLQREHLSGVNVDVVDLTGAVQIGGLWADYTHLNQKGAPEFTELLAGELKKLGI